MSHHLTLIPATTLNTKLKCSYRHGHVVIILNIGVVGTIGQWSHGVGTIGQWFQLHRWRGDSGGMHMKNIITSTVSSDVVTHEADDDYGEDDQWNYP